MISFINYTTTTTAAIGISSIMTSTRSSASDYKNINIYSCLRGECSRLQKGMDAVATYFCYYSSNSLRRRQTHPNASVIVLGLSQCCVISYRAY